MQRQVTTTTLSIVADVVNNLQAVGKELVVQNPVSDLHGEEDSHNVHGFPDGKLPVVVVVFTSELNKILSYLRRPGLEPIPILSRARSVSLWTKSPVLVFILVIILSP